MPRKEPGLGKLTDFIPPPDDAFLTPYGYMRVPDWSVIRKIVGDVPGMPTGTESVTGKFDLLNALMASGREREAMLFLDKEMLLSLIDMGIVEPIEGGQYGDTLENIESGKIVAPERQRGPATAAAIATQAVPRAQQGRPQSLTTTTTGAVTRALQGPAGTTAGTTPLPEQAGTQKGQPADFSGIPVNGSEQQMLAYVKASPENKSRYLQWINTTDPATGKNPGLEWVISHNIEGLPEADYELLNGAAPAGAEDKPSVTDMIRAHLIDLVTTGELDIESYKRADDMVSGLAAKWKQDSDKYEPYVTKEGVNMTAFDAFIRSKDVTKLLSDASIGKLPDPAVRVTEALSNRILSLFDSPAAYVPTELRPYVVKAFDEYMFGQKMTVNGTEYKLSSGAWDNWLRQNGNQLHPTEDMTFLDLFRFNPDLEKQYKESFIKNAPVDFESIMAAGWGNGLTAMAAASGLSLQDWQAQQDYVGRWGAAVPKTVSMMGADGNMMSVQLGPDDPANSDPLMLYRTAAEILRQKGNLAPSLDDIQTLANQLAYDAENASWMADQEALPERLRAPGYELGLEPPSWVVGRRQDGQVRRKPGSPGATPAPGGDIPTSYGPLAPAQGKGSGGDDVIAGFGTTRGTYSDQGLRDVNFDAWKKMAVKYFGDSSKEIKSWFTPIYDDFESTGFNDFSSYLQSLGGMEYIGTFLGKGPKTDDQGNYIQPNPIDQNMPWQGVRPDIGTLIQNTEGWWTSPNTPYSSTSATTEKGFYQSWLSSFLMNEFSGQQRQDIATGLNKGFDTLWDEFAGLPPTKGLDFGGYIYDLGKKYFVDEWTPKIGGTGATSGSQPGITPPETPSTVNPAWRKQLAKLNQRRVP